MRQSIYFIGLLALLAACNSPKTEEAKQQNEAALQEESMPVAQPEPSPAPPDEEFENKPYVSKNFYGNGVEEYLLIEGGKYFYWSSKNGKRIQLEISELKEQVVGEIALIITGKMRFPGDNKVYKFVQYESGLSITHPDGKVQSYDFEM
jgi:hypothetical protein